METILSTAFGHQAEILRGKAENDELYKAAKKLSESLNFSGPSGFFGLIAIQCKSMQYFYIVVKNLVSMLNNNNIIFVAHIPQFLIPLVRAIANWLLPSSAKDLTELTRSLVNARRQMNPSNRVC